jgi:hypothetical protein
MDAWLILLIVVAVLLALAVGGAIAQRRRLRASRGRFREHLEEANLDLAAAHAGDKGWEPGALEQAAHRALAEEAGAQTASLTLVQVVDRPGTEDDRAVFRVDLPDGRQSRLTMARHEGGWVSLGLD